MQSWIGVSFETVLFEIAQAAVAIRANASWFAPGLALFAATPDLIAEAGLKSAEKQHYRC